MIICLHAVFFWYSCYFSNWLSPYNNFHCTAWCSKQITMWIKIIIALTQNPNLLHSQHKTLSYFILSCGRVMMWRSLLIVKSHFLSEHSFSSLSFSTSLSVCLSLPLPTLPPLPPPPPPPHSHTNAHTHTHTHTHQGSHSLLRNCV